jgi:hypothetical protein
MDETRTALRFDGHSGSAMTRLFRLRLSLLPETPQRVDRSSGTVVWTPSSSVQLPGRFRRVLAENRCLGASLDQEGLPIWRVLS